MFHYVKHPEIHYMCKNIYEPSHVFFHVIAFSFLGCEAPDPPEVPADSPREHRGGRLSPNLDRFATERLRVGHAHFST